MPHFVTIYQYGVGIVIHTRYLVPVLLIAVIIGNHDATEHQYISPSLHTILGDDYYLVYPSRSNEVE